MSTISRKNVQTLINDYKKRPREFQNYSKHCINILKNYVYLKENQFNYDVDGADYFIKFIRYFGMNNMFLINLFNKYYEDIITKIDDDKKIIIKSNMYYLNRVDIFRQNISFNNNLIGDNRQNMKFNRLDFLIIRLDNTINLDKEYSYSEIYDMVLNHKIIVLNNFISDECISETELLEEIKLGNKICVESSCCEFLGFNSKVIDNLFTFKCDQDKKIWAVINEPFCNYIRNNIISFGADEDRKKINLSADFYDTIEHLLDITSGVSKCYKNKKTQIIEETINNNKKQIKKYKENFESINNDKKIYVLN